jgi:transposase
VNQYLLELNLKQFHFYKDALRGIDAKILEAVARTDLGEGVRHVSSIPGIGYITAVTIVAELGSVERFKDGREAAVSCGLTPRLRGSAGQTYTGRISKTGSKAVR